MSPNTEKKQNPVAQLRERFKRIKENQKPSKEVEETFITPKQEKTESNDKKKIARKPEMDV